jgi:hypothetical protein
MSDDQRGSRRARVLKSATMALGGGSITCTVRNMSTAGAQLIVESPIGIPTEFTLVITSDSDSRVCRVIWRSGSSIGVRFAGAAR